MLSFGLDMSVEVRHGTLQDCVVQSVALVKP